MYLSAYSGADIFGIESKENFDHTNYSRLSGHSDWGNIISALRWNYQITSRLFSNTTLTHSRFKFDFNSTIEEVISDDKDIYAAYYFSGIYDWAGKIDLDFIPNPNHFIRFGIGVTHHTYDPGVFQYEVNFGGDLINTIVGSKTNKSIEYNAYIEDDFRIGAFSTNIGLHTAIFNVNKKTYCSIQPRLGIKYLFNNNFSLKASYTKMTQFINLLTNESLNLPTDLWVPSTDKIAPQNAWQVAGGFATTMFNFLEVSIEGYYKNMENVISYKEGASFIGVDQDWQEKVTQGNGNSYGLEFFFQKKSGRITGWLGYTLSWNWRKFNELNGGNRFPFKYDRRHDVSLVLSYQINDNLTMSSTWVYGTGNSITLPLYRYNYFNTEVENINSKNSFRMAPYHRMDLSVELQSKKNKFRKWKSSWVFSIYNSYNRNNPYFISTGRNENGERVFKQTSIFPLIPSVNYKFKF